MAEVSIDMLEEIFVRLSVKDLIQCKRVCKSWYFLISDERFIKFHLNADNGIGDTRIFKIFLGDDLPDVPPAVQNHYDHSRNNYYDECHIVGSSNGLVCLSRFNIEILVVNPSTREVKKLADPQVKKARCSSQCYIPPINCCSCYCWGFGYDSSSDDYKVVLGFRKGPYMTCFQVLTLKSNVWKSVGHVDYSIMSQSSSDAIFCYGALHWIMTVTGGYNRIVSFDLSKEEFKEIPLPNDGFLMRGPLRLGLIKDSQLCCFYHTSNIRVMKNYGSVEQCWELYEPGLLLNRRYEVTEEIYMLPSRFFGRFPPIGLSAYYSEELTAPVFVQSLVSPLIKEKREIIDQGRKRIRSLKS